MKKISLFLFFLATCWAGFLLFQSQEEKKKCPCGGKKTEIAQYSYEGPTRPVPGNPHLVKVELLVRDSPIAGGPQIQSVYFNGVSIPLKPRDIYGNRGSAGFQLAPGKYRLRWIVTRDTKEWPREVTREEEVNVDPKDLWLQISIEGEEASIR